MNCPSQLASPVVARRRVGPRFALRALYGVLVMGMVVQCPGFATATSSTARSAPTTSQSSEEERPVETSETLAAHSSATQGRKAVRGLLNPPLALRMPLLNASGCMAARHHDGGRMLVCDIRLGTGLPLRL